MPDAPQPAHDVVKPFALTVVVCDRIHGLPHSDDVWNDYTVGGGVMWHVPHVRDRLSLSTVYGYAINRETQSLTFAATAKVWEFGLRR